MSLFDTDFYNFMESVKSKGWALQYDPTEGSIEIYKDDKTIAMDDAYLKVYTMEYIIKRIEETFDSIPNDPKMKKSKRWKRVGFDLNEGWLK